MHIYEINVNADGRSFSLVSAAVRNVLSHTALTDDALEWRRGIRGEV